MICRSLTIFGLAALLGSSLGAQTAGPSPQKKSAAKPVQATKPATVPAPTQIPQPPPPPPPVPTGVRLKTVTTQGAQVSENVTYIQGARQRVEFPGVVSIDQCDTKQTVMLNPAAKRYKTQAYPEAPVQTTTAAPPAAPPPAAPAVMPGMPTQAQMAGMDPAMMMQLQMAQMQMAQMQAQQGGGRGTGGMGMGMPPQPKGGVVTITTTITDTLERQKMFGYDARHVKTIVVKQFTPTACDKAPYKLEMDAWYVDLPARKGCPKMSAEPPAPPASTDPNACTDRLESRTVGDAKLGFPVKLTTTTTTGEGEATDIVTTHQEVTELEVSKLDDTLFDTPGDFAEATSSAEIVPAIATGGSLADALFGSTATGTSTPAAKKPGVIRIGVLEPVNKTARNLVPNAHRDELVRKFSKPPYEALPVRGNSMAAIEGEAARLGVDYLLLTEVVDVKTSKPGKLGGMVSKATKEESKEKHEVKIDYKLYAAGATKAPVVSGNAKGSNGGFTMTQALKLAMLAGQIYMGGGGMFMTGGMGGPMGALGMMNPMMAMSGTSTSLGLIGGLYDPRAAAMRSLAMSLMGGGMGPGGMPNMASMLGGGDPSEAEMLDTVSEALGNEAKAAIEQLSKKITVAVAGCRLPVGVADPGSVTRRSRPR